MTAAEAGMIEARRFEDIHQAGSLARWCDGTVFTVFTILTILTGVDHPCIEPGRARDGGRRHAGLGDWIIRYPDGTARVDGPGNQDGYCTGCGDPVWWWDGDLITRDGQRWCFGPDRSRVTMERWHALPGMAQYVAPAREGQVCHCLARPGPHIHQIVPAP